LTWRISHAGLSNIRVSELGGVSPGLMVSAAAPSIRGLTPPARHGVAPRMGVRTMCPCLLVVLAFLGSAEPEAPAPNPLLKQLVGEGFPIPGGAQLKLPAPFMTDGMTAKQQEEVLAKATEKIPVEAFLQKSDTAPISQKV